MNQNLNFESFILLVKIKCNSDCFFMAEIKFKQIKSKELKYTTWLFILMQNLFLQKERDYKE